MLSPSQFSYCRGLGSCDALHALSHRLQVALDGGMDKRFIQLNFSTVFHEVSHYGLLYKLRSVFIG